LTPMSSYQRTTQGGTAVGVADRPRSTPDMTVAGKGATPGQAGQSPYNFPVDRRDPPVGEEEPSSVACPSCQGGQCPKQGTPAAPPAGGRAARKTGGEIIQPHGPALGRARATQPAHEAVPPAEVKPLAGVPKDLAPLAGSAASVTEVPAPPPAGVG